MIFPEGKSALVRLSDCIKLGVGNALDTTVELTELHKKFAPQLSTIRQLAREALQSKFPDVAVEEELKRRNGQIPIDEAQKAISLQGRLHSEVLTVILHACFALESYINSLGYHLIKEKDILGLVAHSTTSTADTFFEAIDRMSTLSKWETLGRLKSNQGFDSARPPFQDLKILFRFRDDHVHDKVVEYGDDRAGKRYGGKFPDPVAGILHLSHAVYACDCYWNMVTEIHNLIGFSREDFHRHYNLSPWFSKEFEREVRKTAEEYQKTSQGN